MNNTAEMLPQKNMQYVEYTHSPLPKKLGFHIAYGWVMSAFSGANGLFLTFCGVKDTEKMIQ